MRLLPVISGAIAATLLANGASDAHADTLREALVKAYQSNPTLTGARSGQRALDETEPLARADGLPDLSAGATFTENIVTGESSFLAPERSLAGQVDLNVPIYSGGAVRNSIRAARDRIEAGRANLRATESAVFSAVVQAYMDVIRAESILDLNSANVRVLGVNLQATSDRFEIGDLTRTDVAQSDARLALARSDLATARSNLIGARERYVQLVGDSPGELEPPPPLPDLPDSPEAAVSIALDSNPDLLAAREAVEAAKHDVGVARASRLPRLGGFASASRVDYLGSLDSDIPGFNVDQTSNAGSVGVRATIPIFQGGRPGALVRQSQAQLSQNIEREIETERDIIAQVRSAFASREASLRLIQSSQRAVEAATLSLEGVRAENSVGNRTILDILDAEQELLNAQVQLVTARRNAYVAGFTLLAAMGRAEARDLGLDGGILYDPLANYERVRRRIWDWDSDPEPQPQATRTVDTPAQKADNGE